MCESWVESFDNFLADMGERPDGLTLERIDVDGPYALGNCRWATMAEQSINRRASIWVEHDGQRLPLKAYVALRGVNYESVGYRMRQLGETAKEAADHLSER